MKKSLFLGAIFCIVLGVSPLFAKDIPFEDQLNNAATEISAEIEGKVSSLAILDVYTEYWAVSDYIVDELAHYFTRRFGAGNVIAHDDFTRALISQEFDYQHSGDVSDETIQEIGRELGVDCVIIGDFTQISSGWNLFVKATQVETKKLLSSWKGKISAKDKEVKFQIEKSKKSPRPNVTVKKKPPVTENEPEKNDVPKNALGISAEMIDESGKSVSVLHPRDTIRFRVSAEKSAYLAILCTDANGTEEWLPLKNKKILAGESRIFPDIPGAVLRVQDGIFGNESVTVYASVTEAGLPQQGKMMGTRKINMEFGGTDAVESVISYRVER